MKLLLEQKEKNSLENLVCLFTVRSFFPIFKTPNEDASWLGVFKQTKKEKLWLLHLSCLLWCCNFRCISQYAILLRHVSLYKMTGMLQLCSCEYMFSYASRLWGGWVGKAHFQDPCFSFTRLNVPSFVAPATLPVISKPTSSWRWNERQYLRRYHTFDVCSDVGIVFLFPRVKFQQRVALAVLWFEKKGKLWICVCFDMRVFDIWHLDLKYWKKVDSYLGRDWFLTFVFHACGSQFLNFEMPGSERVLTDSFLARRMHDNDLTEDQLFGYREDELPHIQAGTVMLIPEVEKERVLDLLQETLRLRIELGALVSGVRGDPYVRSMSARGDDFLYVSVQPVQHLSTSPVAFLLQRLFKHLESKYIPLTFQLNFDLRLQVENESQMDILFLILSL